MAFEVLIVDDESDIRSLVSDILKDGGFHPKTAANSTEVFNILNEKVPGAIILDIWLQGSDLDGLGILEIVKKRYPLLPVIVISGHGTIETAVAAIKMGAYDYIEKPFTHEKLMIVLKRACEAARLKMENLDLKSKVVYRSEIIGNSSAIHRLKSEVEKVSPTSGRVMIFGPTGCGKELTARLIHKRSKYSSGPFIAFSPTGLSEEKIKYELFGELPSNYDQATIHTKRTSVIEAANNGILYVDEVADLPMNVQSRLLKFLQDQVIEKNNNSKSVKLDLRIITATARNIQEEIALGKFRQDLYYRLNVVPIKVPPLSERKEDIPSLVRYLVKQIKFSGLKEREFSNEALAALQAYHWPGNIRQLRNVIEWTLIMNPITIHDNSQIRADMLPSDIINNSITITKPDTNNVDMMSMPLREAREVFERQYLSAQMSRFNNNISKTSAFVGMERSALHRKLKLLNISAHNKENQHSQNNINNEGAISNQSEECLA